MGITAVALPFLGGIGLPELIILLLIFVVLLIPVWFLWKIFERAGMPGAYALLMLIPWVGEFVVLGVLAFARWPVLEQPGVQVALPVRPPPQVVPAGWYPDPNGDGGQRYWDGSAWTTHAQD